MTLNVKKISNNNGKSLTTFKKTNNNFSKKSSVNEKNSNKKLNKFAKNSRQNNNFLTKSKFKKNTKFGGKRRIKVFKKRSLKRNYWLSRNARWFFKKRWQPRTKIRLKRYLLNLKAQSKGLGLWLKGVPRFYVKKAIKSIRKIPYSSTFRLRSIYARAYLKKYQFPYHKRVKTLSGMPKYINYRQLFHNQMIEKQTFRAFYRLKERKLIKIFRKAMKGTKRQFDVATIKHFEFRLDTVVYRANMAFSLLQARQQVKLGYFTVNNNVMVQPNYAVKVGDCVMPKSSLIQNWTYCFSRLYSRPLQVDQYPEYLMINERVPVALISQNPRLDKIKHALPISWQFMSFAMLKYT